MSEIVVFRDIYLNTFVKKNVEPILILFDGDPSGSSLISFINSYHLPQIRYLVASVLYRYRNSDIEFVDHLLSGDPRHRYENELIEFDNFVKQHIPELLTLLYPSGIPILTNNPIIKSHSKELDIRIFFQKYRNIILRMWNEGYAIEYIILTIGSLRHKHTLSTEYAILIQQILNRYCDNYNLDISKYRNSEFHKFDTYDFNTDFEWLEDLDRKTIERSKRKEENAKKRKRIRRYNDF